MERIANPVSGRVESAPRRAAPQVTRGMLLCRYACAFLAPALLLVWCLLPQDGWHRIALLGAWLVLSLPLSAGANGSWWSAPWDVWHASMAVESVVIIGAMGWSMLSGDPLVIPFAMTLLVGAVLGAGATHLWRSRA